MKIEYKNIILRDMIESDIEDYVRWFTVEREWENRDAPWEKEDTDEETECRSFTEYYDSANNGQMGFFDIGSTLVDETEAWDHMVREMIAGTSITFKEFGDRLDNDMIPAKALGMKTVWLKNGLAKHQSAELGNGFADYQFYKLPDLLSILYPM